MNIAEIKDLITQFTKHFNYDKDIINILTICYIAIVSIDPEVSDILEEVLSTKYILINDGNFNNMLRKYYPDLDLYYDTYYEPTFDNISCHRDDFIVLARFDYLDISETLEGFIHELKHAMNSIIKRYEEGIFKCGLCEIIKINNQNQHSYLLLEEAFNSFLTKIYLKQIKKLKELKLNDNELQIILNNFNIYNYQYSYNKITTILEPLFCDAEFFILFYNAALYKDYEPLYNKLENFFKENIDIIDMLIEECYYNDNTEIKDYISSYYQSISLNIKIPDIRKMIP